MSIQSMRVFIQTLMNRNSKIDVLEFVFLLPLNGLRQQYRTFPENMFHIDNMLLDKSDHLLYHIKLIWLV